MFYVSIPLDFQLSRKERQQWTAGMQLQGKRDYQAIRIDSTMLNVFSLNDIDAKWMIAGVVATGAAVAIGSKDKKTTDNLQRFGSAIVMGIAVCGMHYTGMYAVKMSPAGAPVAATGISLPPATMVSTPAATKTNTNTVSTIHTLLPVSACTCGSPVTSGLVNTVEDSSPSTQFSAFMVAVVSVLRTA